MYRALASLVMVWVPLGCSSVQGILQVGSRSLWTVARWQLLDSDLLFNQWQFEREVISERLKDSPSHISSYWQCWDKDSGYVTVYNSGSVNWYNFYCLYHSLLRARMLGWLSLLYMYHITAQPPTLVHAIFTPWNALSTNPLLHN